MNTIVFDGIAHAQFLEKQLQRDLHTLQLSGVALPVIGAVCFSEDFGSKLYTTKKAEMAQRLGIEYKVEYVSFADTVEQVQTIIQNFNQNKAVTGIIVQKPARTKWVEWNRLHSQSGGDLLEEKNGGEPIVKELSQMYYEEFTEWWRSLVEVIDPTKDVDGLHPSTLEAIRVGTWREQGRVLPATVQAVLSILDVAQTNLASDNYNQNIYSKNIVILGKSDILGLPLFYELRSRGCSVEMIGSKELAQRVANGQMLMDKQVIISATGRQHLITGDMVHDGVIIIDVGEPKADVHSDTVLPKSSFFTPVPGGVGPVTVASLMHNSVVLAQKREITTL